MAGFGLLQPAFPMMCSNAEGATRPPSWPANYTHPQAFPSSGMPTYSLSVQFIVVFNMVGGAISNVVLGSLSDRYGRRPCLILGLSMGAVTLVLTYIAGVAVENYWFFVAVQFVNGLFSGTRP
eukprot:7041346-Prymnesium_polylepis.1